MKPISWNLDNKLMHAPKAGNLNQASTSLLKVYTLRYQDKLSLVSTSMNGFYIYKKIRWQWLHLSPKVMYTIGLRHRMQHADGHIQGRIQDFAVEVGVGGGLGNC